MEWKNITKENLKNLIDNNTIVSIGKMFGISDTAVKKKAKRMGIWQPRYNYNGHNDNKRKIKNYHCLWCGDKLTKKSKKYCSNQCRQDYEYHIKLNQWKIGVYNTSVIWGVPNFIKRYLWKKYNGKCSRCGWDTPNPYINRVILEIEHIDGNSENNKEDNLDLICPNCHSLTATYKALNKGSGRKDRMMRYYNKQTY